MTIATITLLNPLPPGFGVLVYTITDQSSGMPVSLSLSSGYSVMHPVNRAAGPWLISATVTDPQGTPLDADGFTLTSVSATLTVTLSARLTISEVARNDSSAVQDPSASLASSVTGAVAAPPAAVLPFTMQTQMQTNWGWAAITASVAAYYNPLSTCTQCSLANWAFSMTTCCLPSSAALPPCNSPYDIRSALTHTGNLRQAISSAMTFADVAAEIDAGRPVVVRLVWESVTAGHDVVIVGYDKVAQSITVKDSFYSTSVLLFRSFPVNYKGASAWTSTFTTQPA
jgi:hypothetical protein